MLCIQPAGYSTFFPSTLQLHHVVPSVYSPRLSIMLGNAFLSSQAPAYRHNPPYCSTVTSPRHIHHLPSPSFPTTYTYRHQPPPPPAFPYPRPSHAFHFQSTPQRLIPRAFTTANSPYPTPTTVAPPPSSLIFQPTVIFSAAISFSFPRLPTFSSTSSPLRPSYPTNRPTSSIIITSHERTSVFTGYSPSTMPPYQKTAILEFPF